jgi:outer membrane receptor for monomeric catechols
LLIEAATKRRANRFDFGDSMTNRMFVVSPLAGALSLALSAPALAAPAGEPMQATDLDKVEVIGQSVEKPSSVKYTEPLLDTPQTITVVTKDVMDAQGLLSLRDVLTTLPGITFGAGEGGGWLRRQHQPARLQRQQRHHYRQRPRQRPVQPHRHL